MHVFMLRDKACIVIQRNNVSRRSSWYIIRMQARTHTHAYLYSLTHSFRSVYHLESPRSFEQDHGRNTSLRYPTPLINGTISSILYDSGVHRAPKLLDVHTRRNCETDAPFALTNNLPIYKI